MQLIGVTLAIAIACSIAGLLPAAGVSAAPCYPAVFVFGDALSDTGNGNLTGNPFFTNSARRPYGETVPGFPAARNSDGLLLVDFLATRVGLPHLKPSLDNSANFSLGVNYAVYGATAQDPSYLRSRLIFPLTDLSLDVQIGWHLALKASGPGPRKPSIDAYNNGLYVLEMGNDDYLGALQSIYSVSYITTNFIPLVIAKIRNATEVLYANGARKFLYMSIPPFGCSPSLLTRYPLGAKDSNGCLRDLNTLSYNHGTSLLNLVNDLRSSHPAATFVFFDYYAAYTQVIGNSLSYGFSNTLDACCGAGPAFPYRYNVFLFCNFISNTALGTLCPNPNVFLSWNGIHFTHRFNSIVFNITVNQGSYLNPSNAFLTCNATV